MWCVKFGNAARRASLDVVVYQRRLHKHSNTWT